MTPATDQNLLNPHQKEAVLHNEGPLLILAGAGTGKTKVLTERIIHLINSYQANAREIMAVTFTNKAAAEMKNRIAAKIGDEVNNIWVGTFHSLASRILKRHAELVGLKSDFTIIDSDDQLRLLKQITAEFDIDNKEFPAKNYLYQIERYKDKAISARDLADNYNQGFEKLPKLLQVYNNYQERLKSINAADFGDLLLYNLEIFKISTETLSYYQNKFHYVLVDEYQDTNAAQYRWLLKLTGKYKNICAVGDDDQSIYSWRGAEIANILKFEKDFPGTKIVRLERNYRSLGNILKAASHLIKNNAKRHSKTLWTEHENGNKIKLLSFLDDRSEANNIGFIIKNLQKESGINLNNIAILVRASYQTRAFEESFIQNSLPYRIVGGLRFYERKEIKDCIAYLRVVSNHQDDLALQRIINLPKRGVGDTTIANLFEKAASEKSSLFTSIRRTLESGTLKGKAKEALKQLITHIEEWHFDINHQSVSELAKRIISESGYLQMWQSEKTPDAEGRVENIKEFISSLEEFENLGEFLEYVSLVSGSEKIDEQIPMVNIMTVHSAKGLEFEVIFIPGLEDGVFPSSKAISERNGIEEERRLLYVAITRAKKDLYLTLAQNRMVYGNFQVSIPSQFLKELPEEIIEVNTPFPRHPRESGDIILHDEIPAFAGMTKGVGMTKNVRMMQNNNNQLLNKRIFHQKFGYGKVIEIEGDRLNIIFEKAGTKTIMRNFVEVISH